MDTRTYATYCLIKQATSPIIPGLIGAGIGGATGYAVSRANKLDKDKHLLAVLGGSGIGGLAGYSLGKAKNKADKERSDFIVSCLAANGGLHLLTMNPNTTLDLKRDTPLDIKKDTTLF